MAKTFRFKKGDKVKLHATKTSSNGLKVHDGEIVTIKARCKFTYAYELEELSGLWADGCFKKIE